MGEQSISANLSTPSTQKRKSQRLQLFMPTSVRPGSSENNAQILNISRSGLLLQTSTSQRVHDEIDVEIPEVGNRKARIVWRSADLAGCEFEQPLRKADLSRLKLGSLKTINRPQEALGDRIKRLRVGVGLSLEGLAQRIGTSKPTVWKWETGKTIPSRSYFLKLCEALAVKEVELAYGKAMDLQTDHEGKTADRALGLAEVISSSRAAIAEAAGIDEDDVEILIKEH